VTRRRRPLTHAQGHELGDEQPQCLEGGRIDDGLERRQCRSGVWYGRRPVRQTSDDVDAHECPLPIEVRRPEAQPSKETRQAPCTGKNRALGERAGGVCAKSVLHGERALGNDLLRRLARGAHSAPPWAGSAGRSSGPPPRRSTLDGREPGARFAPRSCRATLLRELVLFAARSAVRVSLGRAPTRLSRSGLGWQAPARSSCDRQDAHRARFPGVSTAGPICPCRVPLRSCGEKTALCRAFLLLYGGGGIRTPGPGHPGTTVFEISARWSL
jgi:hypothetical protein